MSCIFSASFVAMVNDVHSLFSKPLKVSDKEILYCLLFIIVMEVLNKMFMRARYLRMFRSLKVEGGRMPKR